MLARRLCPLHAFLAEDTRNLLVDLSAEEMILLLQSSELEVDCENSVFTAVSIWADENKWEGAEIASMLWHLRYFHMDRDFLCYLPFDHLFEEMEEGHVHVCVQFRVDCHHFFLAPAGVRVATHAIQCRGGWQYRLSMCR